MGGWSHALVVVAAVALAARCCAAAPLENLDDHLKGDFAHVVAEAVGEDDVVVRRVERRGNELVIDFAHGDNADHAPAHEDSFDLGAKANSNANTFSFSFPQDSNATRNESEAFRFHPGSAEEPTQRRVCPSVPQPSSGLFRRYICHLFPDHTGRRRRRPAPDCPFAMVGVRGVEMVRNAVDLAENQLGLEVDDFDFASIGHNLMHQGLIYGKADGTYDYTSGYYCGQQADSIGLNYYGWVCQDPDVLVQNYRPISNETIALDNWIPYQYDLVGRKFNCDRLWRAEQAVAWKYDSCTHADTAYPYRTIWHNCHTYIDDVVGAYDELEKQEAGGSPERAE